MSEQTMRRRVVRTLRPLDAVAVENPCCPGTPDVNFADGWIELKWLRSWPRDASSLVTLPHFTPQQRIWISQRWRRGGRVWVLLQVGHDWLLFDGQTAADKIGYYDRETLLVLATQCWMGGLRDEEFVECMRDMGPGEPRADGRRPVDYRPPSSPSGTARDSSSTGDD